MTESRFPITSAETRPLSCYSKVTFIALEKVEG